MNRAFVTRSFRKNDPIKALLEAEGYQVEGHSMLTFAKVDDQQLPDCDFVFAYSRNGVLFLDEALLEQIKEKQIPVAAMGQATSEAWNSIGLTCFFIGSGAPEGVASAFAKTLHSSKISSLSGSKNSSSKPIVCFLEATSSRRSVEGLLGETIEAVSVKCYENKIDAKALVPECDLLFLTSPMNAQAALSQVAITSQPKIWCIGETTAAQVVELGFTIDRTVDLPTL